MLFNGISISHWLFNAKIRFIYKCLIIIITICGYDYHLTEDRYKLATVVEGDPKAPFSIATIPRCRGGRYSFPWIAPLYPWYVAYIAEG